MVMVILVRMVVIVDLDLDDLVYPNSTCAAWGVR